MPTTNVGKRNSGSLDLGMMNNGTALDLDDIIIKLGSGTALSDPLSSGVPGSLDITNLELLLRQ